MQKTIVFVAFHDIAPHDIGSDEVHDVAIFYVASHDVSPRDFVLPEIAPYDTTPHDALTLPLMTSHLMT